MAELQQYLEAEFNALKEQINDLQTDFRDFRVQVRNELQTLYKNRNDKSSAIGFLKGQIGAVYVLLGSAIAALIGSLVTLFFSRK